MILYTPEDHGCAYTIDTEGTLYYIPIHSNGILNFGELCEVDYEELRDGGYEDEVQEVHQKLIQMMKSVGEYYIQAAVN
jgi:hypothetical protein